MNRKLILIFLLTISQTSWSQDCDFEIRNLSNNLNGKSELLEKLEYEKVVEISEKLIDYQPKSELELTKTYPEIFKLKDSCYTFRANADDGIGINKGLLKACKNKVKSKEYSDFKFKGVYCGNALIEITGYESWGFLSVDLKNGLTCFTMGKPITSDGQIAISYSNYYGEEEIALTDLKTKEQYVIGIEGWRTVDVKINENIYYLKLESDFQTNCKKEIKYLKLKIKN
ncbi:hypothetical protein Q4Q35_15815 [Flavivirga aquimarina]|uniref:Uncharacterized protein n=1 Tax=Flavivirga aquimarina TaxID=2027862 RepID=A0ABT8WDP1_9FLAO|nr:hypothetical protein [Flavivirga aquimarina]MDO5971275.1 hypothetical protein [Flavivirga aquimarina]